MTFLPVVTKWVLCALLLMLAKPAAAEERITLGFMSGVMTTNKIDVLYHWSELDFDDSYFAGFMVGYEQPLRYENWSAGAEFHLNQFFGDDTYGEIVLAGTVRYAPPNPWVSLIDSYAFGLGVSHTSETPEVEVITRGDSQRTLVYMAIETAFDVGLEDSEVFLRLHHRSDGYGLFSKDTGSNAFAIGFRKEFGRR